MEKVAKRIGITTAGLLAGVLWAGSAGAELRLPPWIKGVTAQPRVELKLTEDPVASERAGHPVLVATLVNTGKVPVSLVHPAHGSLEGWRPPLIGWSVIDASDPKARHPERMRPSPTGARCDYVAALRPGAVFRLHPGESMVVGPLADTLIPPGRWSVRLYYENDPTHPWRGTLFGQHDAETQRALILSTPVRLVSEEVIVEVPRGAWD